MNNEQRNLTKKAHAPYIDPKSLVINSLPVSSSVRSPYKSQLASTMPGVPGPSLVPPHDLMELG